MPDDLNEAEKKLRKLGDRLRLAWDALYPVSEEDLEAAREGVREQWAEEREESLQGQEPSETQEPDQAQANKLTPKRGKEDAGQATKQEETQPAPEQEHKHRRRR